MSTPQNSSGGGLPRDQAVRLICWQFVGSAAILIGIGTYLAGRNSPQPIEPLVAQGLALYAVVVLFAAGKIENLIAKAGAKNGGSQGAQTAAIVGFAIRESAALIGLILTILTGDPVWVQVLGSLTIGAMLLALKQNQPGA